MTDKAMHLEPPGSTGCNRPQILHPAHPERVCWGCDKLCPADFLACGNGTIRTLHPIELFGEDWAEWFNRNEGK